MTTGTNKLEFAKQWPNRLIGPVTLNNPITKTTDTRHDSAMKTLKTILVAATSLLVFAATAGADVFEPEEIISRMKKAADWQLANPPPNDPLEWHSAPFYMGLSDLSEITGERRYIDKVKAVAEAHDWKIRDRPYHADDHAVGLSFIKLHEIDPSPEKIASIRKEFDWILANPPKEAVVGKNGKIRETYNRERWNWSDALYMAPAVWAGLAAVTGEEKYNSYMVREWKKAHEWFFDEDEDLYFHDKRDIVKVSPGGKKVFWARGDGWVIAGLVEVLQHLPQDHAERPYFESIFKRMAAKLLVIQKDNGTWAPSLLDPLHPPQDDTSGTVFFVYGFAWGMNNGLLDPTIYESATRKGWQALCDRQKPRGRLINTQPVGGFPVAFDPDTTAVFGIGGFLSAGSEIFKMVNREDWPIHSANKP